MVIFPSAMIAEVRQTHRGLLMIASVHRSSAGIASLDAGGEEVFPALWLSPPKTTSPTPTPASRTSATTPATTTSIRRRLDASRGGASPSSRWRFRTPSGPAPPCPYRGRVPAPPAGPAPAERG